MPPLAHSPIIFPAPTKTKIAAEWKAAKEAKQKEAKDKKAAAATRKADSLSKKQEKRISSTKAKASTVAAKAESFCSKLADVMKAAAVPEAAHLHKKSNGMLGNVPTNPPPAHMLSLSLSPQWKSMSVKKRVRVQSPLCPSYNKEDELLLDESVMSVSSRSSGTSSTTTVEKDYSTFLMPTALRHVSQGCLTPAHGCRGCRYSVPLGRSRGRQTKGGATLGPSTQRLLWLANLDSAITASTLARSGSLTPVAIAHFDTVE